MSPEQSNVEIVWHNQRAIKIVDSGTRLESDNYFLDAVTQVWSCGIAS